MPPISAHAGGHLRRILLLVLVAAIAAGVYACNRLGPYLAQEDPLQKADAIVVLAGTRMLRPLEGADLYLEGYAPLLVMTRETEDPGYRVVAGRGHVIERDADRTREIFVAMGIPRDAILIPDQVHDSTAAEAETVRELADRRGWRRVIVVTSRFHLTRSGFAMRRALGNRDVQVIMRASRYDPLTPEGWWTRRPEVRWVVSEFPKLVAYMLGLGA